MVDYSQKFFKYDFSIITIFYNSLDNLFIIFMFLAPVTGNLWNKVIVNFNIKTPFYKVYKLFQVMQTCYRI
jgi:hypothetical protein